MNHTAPYSDPAVASATVPAPPPEPGCACRHAAGTSGDRPSLAVPRGVLAEFPGLQAGCDECRAGMPEPLWRFMCGKCRLPAHALHHLPASRLPEPYRQLLAHSSDMTSTLGAFHRCRLTVEILQRTQLDEVYLREVFLRSQPADRIVEYGVIAILLNQFTAAQQEAIQAGRAPLGGLLHQFKIPFTSAPIGFFSASSAILPRPPPAPDGATPCYGRFNRLSTPAGSPLAWIMEILPPASFGHAASAFPA
ncbi:MAG: hypothetical protein FJ399_03915 [Verrucomicrobia bacterium]|nr:hypothetical protein [Verrucomicrobiota bacterium]